MMAEQNGKLKIAILALTFPPYVGGTEIATYNIATHLAKLGHSVDVITSFEKGVPQNYKENGFWVHRIKYLNTKYIGMVSFWLKSLFVLRNANPDIIFAQDLLMSVSGWLFRLLYRRPYIVCGQGSDVFLSKKNERMLYKMTLKNANAVVALSNQMKNEMNNIYPRNIFVIPNGIDPGIYSGISKSDMRKKFNIPADTSILICVARLDPVKGISYLLQSLPNIVRQFDKTKLIIIGGGQIREELESLAISLGLGRYVEFIGEVAYELVPEYLAMADVFVLPSLSEGLPVSVLEAMASGLPVVSTKVGGLPAIIIDNWNGFLVEPGNPRLLSEKIIFLMHNKDIYNEIKKNNILAASNYSWDHIVKELESLMKSSLQQN
jgi:glycosyltransferase involved in cell wall biosynthesis